MQTTKEHNGFGGSVSPELAGQLIRAGLLPERPQEGITFAEAFDFLRSKGYIVTLVPCFTFALREHVAYSYDIATVYESDACLKHITDSEYGSFALEAEAAVKRTLILINS